MKRRRICRVIDSSSMRSRNKNQNSNNKLKQIHYSGPSFSDLPKDITIRIFLRLFVKSIFVCKSVCKTWRDLISDPEFTKLHFDEHCDHQVYPLIQATDFKSQTETLYLVQPDKDEFEQKLNMCDHTYSNPGCVCNVKVALDTKFELPSLDKDFVIDVNNSLYPTFRVGYQIVNSCNGLLCLSQCFDKNFVIVCNPITGEFFDLPKPKKIDSCEAINYGFGFSHVVNQYKVVKIIYHKLSRRYGKQSSRVKAEVHTVGTKSWRITDSKPRYFVHGWPTYFDGFLYWCNGSKSLSLVSFDIENECFGLDLGPKVYYANTYEEYVVGVLGRQLYISSIRESGNFHVWALQISDVGKMWSEVLSIDMLSYGKQMFHNSLKPLKYLSDGSLLMFCSLQNAFVYADHKKGRFRFLKIRGIDSNVITSVSHISSIVSLKQSLSGHNVTVFNFRSRCKELKLHKRSRELHIIEEELPPY